MSVSYSLSSLARAVVGGGFLQLKTRMDPEMASRIFSEASHTAEQQFEELDGDLVSSYGISAAEGGPILTLHLCDTEEALQKYLIVLTEELEEAHVSGRLLPARDIQTPRLRPGAPAVTAVLALELEHDDMISSPRIYTTNPDPSWWVSRERTERVLPALVEWCLAGPGDLHFRSGVGLRISPDQALKLFLNAKARAQSVILTRTTADSMGMRSLYAGFGGEVVLQSYEPDRGWPAQVESLRTPLVSAAPDVLNAFVRIANTGTLGRVAAREAPPAAPVGAEYGGWIWRTARLEGDYVPDAYGQQVMTTSQLQHSDDLSIERWLIEDLGNDRYLVTWKHLEDWFDTDYLPYQVGDDRFQNPTVPSAATLAQARADFGPAILTPEVLDASPLPPFTGTVRR